MSLWLILIQAGLSIAKQHGADGEVISTGGFLIEGARAIDELYEKETGQPLDWSSLKHHEHLPPAGEPTVRETAGPTTEPTGDLQDEVSEEPTTTEESAPESNPEGDDPDKP